MPILLLQAYQPVENNQRLHIPMRIEVTDYLCLMCGDKSRQHRRSLQELPPIVTVLVIVTVVVAEAVGRSSSGSFGGGHSGGGGASSSF